MVGDDTLRVAKCKDQVLIEVAVSSLDVYVLHAKFH